MTQEPSIAFHPRDPRVVAVAVGAGERAPDHVLGLAGEERIIEDCRIAVYVSTDGGGTWEERWPSAPPVPASPGDPYVHRCLRSASVALDEAGSIHLTATDVISSSTGHAADVAWWTTKRLEPFALLAPVSEGGERIYYTRGDDLGSAWSEPVIFADPGYHPSRIARDPASGAILVTMRNREDPDVPEADVAWTDDGGATWRRQEPDQRARCGHPSAVTLTGGEAFLACPRYGGGDGEPRVIHVRVYAFDPGGGSTEVRGEVLVTQEEVMYVEAHVVGLADGRLALLFDANRPYHASGAIYGDTHVAWSADAGRSWTGPQQIRALLPDGWQSARSPGGAAGPGNALHALVGLAGEPRSEGVDRSLRHLVFDSRGVLAHDGEVGSWTRPSGASADATRLRSATHSTWSYGGDDIAWQGGRGLIVESRPELELVLRAGWMAEVGS
ncbi:MAG: sialidase family protein [Methanobacteriota archaeon]